jgi:DNA-binding NarL/FixJ family response regulator
MINIIIVDDHAMVRSGLVKILKDEPEIVIVGEADSHAQLMAKLKTVRPDLILLDISMPGRSGLETLKDLRQFYEDIKVLILSMHPEERYAVRAIRLGAAGYLTKESATDELVKAIRAVCSGGKYITPSLTRLILNSFGDETKQAGHEKLSDREFQILNLIASGKEVKEIANELSLSPTTVATYRTRLMEKMNLKSNVELTTYALRNNLID